MMTAMITKASTALMKSPIRKRLLLTLKDTAEKSGIPPKIPMIGVMMSLVSAVTTAAKDAPITTATARSMTLPRRMNFRKPFIARPSGTPWYRSRVRGGLYGVQLGVLTATRQQLRMAADLDDVCPVEHDDQIGH